jgi:hypothetical protein
MASSTMPRVSNSGRTATAIRVAGEHDVGWETPTTDFVQCVCNLRIVASPISAQQNEMLPNEFLFNALIMQHSLLVDLAGKAPCRSEVDQDRLSLVLGHFKRSVRNNDSAFKKRGRSGNLGRSLRYR